jgi:hypothetical protein
MVAFYGRREPMAASGSGGISSDSRDPGSEKERWRAGTISAVSHRLASFPQEHPARKDFVVVRDVIVAVQQLLVVPAGGHDLCLVAMGGRGIKCPPPSVRAQIYTWYTVIAVIEHVPTEVGT